MRLSAPDGASARRSTAEASPPLGLLRVSLSPAVVHQGKQLLRQEVNPFEVNVDDVIKLRFGHLREGDVQGIAGVVHEIIKAIASPAIESTANIGSKLVK